MEKIILVQPENGLNETNYVPLGLISLAAYVREKFHVKIVDLRFDSQERLFDLIQDLKPLAIGFTMLTGSCISQIIELGKKTKQDYPGIKIIVGGIHPTFFPEQTLRNPAIDFVVINEAERPLRELLEALEGRGNFAKIDNLAWKDSQGRIRINQLSDRFLDLDILPMPAWDLIDVPRYIRSLSNVPDRRVINMYTSKGCPYPCSFCYNLNFNQRKWRARSAERAADEIEFLCRNYGVNYLIIHDDNFVVDRQRALKIAELIEAKGLKLKYSIDARVDAFDYDFFKKLKKSGLYELRVGCESGSDRILSEVIQKGITAKQIIEAVKLAKKLDIKLILSFVMGWPTETIKERQATINLIMKLQKIHPGAAIYPLWIYIPYPGTPLFHKVVEMGFQPPQSLAEWGDYFWGKAHIPWLKNKKEYEIIHDLSPFAWYNKTLATLPDKSLKNMLKFFLIKIFRPLILFRFKYNFWRVPLEVKMIVFLKRLFQWSVKSYEKFIARSV